jgi:hypothetical protein
MHLARHFVVAVTLAAASILCAQQTYAAGPIDICAIVTPADAAAVMGPLPQQPPSKTDNGGFGTTMCMYLGPSVGGQGAQTTFLRLTVQAGTGKDAVDIFEFNADRRKATIDFPKVGDSARRNAQGTFVLAKKGATYCTAEIANGLPRGATADSAAAKLGALCQKVLVH